MSNAYNNIGIIYFMQNNTDKTLEYFFKDLEIAKKSGNKASIAQSYNNIGYVYNILEEYDTALKYHNKSLEIHKELNNQIWMFKNQY